MASITDLDGGTRRCRLCGRPGPYRDATAAHCLGCDREAKERRDTYIRLYHKAKSRATADLIDRYRDEFEELLEARKDELDGWPTEDPEIPILFHPSTPAETLRRAREQAELRKALKAAARAEAAAREELREEVDA